MSSQRDPWARTMRALRAYREITIPQLAALLEQRGETGLSAGTLWRIEQGKRPASRSERRAILDALDFPDRLHITDLEDALYEWDELVDLEDTPQQPGMFGGSRLTRANTPDPAPPPMDLSARIAELRQLVEALARAHEESLQSRRGTPRAQPHRRRPR